MVIILKIMKSHRDGGYIVYVDKDFDNHHTHTKLYNIALVIRDNVNKLRIPKSTDIRMIESHIRIATNKEYLEKLQDILYELNYAKEMRKLIRERENYYMEKYKLGRGVLPEWVTCSTSKNPNS